VSLPPSAPAAQRIPALGDILAEHARSMPDRTAVVCGDVRNTWRQFDDRVSRAAEVLAGAGVGPGGRVLWLGQNCHRLLETLLACARVGAILCPANWRCSADELAFVVADVEPAVVLWQDAEIGEMARKVRAASGDGPVRWVQIDAGAGGDSYEGLLASVVPRRSWPDVEPDEPVVMIYTAAHEGRPNGALLSHRAWVFQNLVTAWVQGTTADDVFLCSGPLFHVGTMRHALSTFQLGGCNVVARRVEAELLCQLIDQERCTGAFIERPTMEQMVAVNGDRRYDLSSLRTAPAFPEWDAMVHTEVRPLRNGFGQTELAGLVTFADTRTPGIGGAGRPSPIAVVDVVDAEGRSVPVGEVGELVVRGPMVMNGYHRRPDLNARRQAGGWHHTADLARREADGTLTFVGPATRIVKSASENIYPAEVEACLRSHPAVAEAAVIGVPDPVWTQAVLAVVVPRPGAQVAAEELVEHCRERIASYKKPKLVEFAGVLPRTPAGAVDYDALDDRFGGGGYPSR
jgi:acyl-CoA synthetase (AMP-forming)/AMP-acid ligase II